MLASPLLVASLLVAGPSARADGVVVAVQEADEVGAWTTWQPAPGTTTAEAYLLRGDERVPLAVGDTVRDHDLVVTRRGRLRVEVPDKGTITIYDDTRVELQDFGLTHQLGGLLIEVQDAFRVEYVQVEAVVEGTRFRVEGDATGRGLVRVEEGRVRVSSPEGEVRVSAGELARLVPGSAPAKEVADAGRRAPAGRRFHPLSIGPQLGGEWATTSACPGLPERCGPTASLGCGCRGPSRWRPRGASSTAPPPPTSRSPPPWRCGSVPWASAQPAT